MKNALTSSLFVAALAATMPALAQTTTTRSAATVGTRALTGTVADSTSRQALAFATVVLRPTANPQAMLSTMTDERGTFQFAGVAAGEYRLEAHYLGYKNSQPVALTVGTAGPVMPVSVVLAPEHQALGEVKVTGNKPFIEQYANKVVLNVAASPIAQGGTAAEVLARAPGVVEQGGGYQVRGKKALVLIDGKPTNLGGNDLAELLASLPSNTLDKVEVVANPSAKYDANGGAVINILTRKNSAFGTNGSVNAGVGAGHFARYNGGVFLTYRRDKLNVFGGLDYQRTKQYRLFESNRVLNQETRIAEASYTVAGRNSQTARLNLDYDLTKRSSVGLQIRGIVSARETNGNTNSTVAGSLAGPPSATNVLQTNGTARGLNPTISVYYRTLLDSAGGELKLNADYLTFNKRFDEQYRNVGYDLSRAEATANALRTYSPASNSVASFTADYTRTFGKATALEAGLKSLRTITDTDIHWENLSEGDAWLNDARRTNHFVYREYINAAYASVRRPMGKKVGAQLGLRAEHTRSEGESLTLNQVNRRDYFNLFPSASLDYSMSQKQQWNVSYQRRIDRFRFDIVNPFLTYVTPYFYYQGNPAIRPSFSNNYSVSHSYNNELMTSVSYSRHTNVLAEVFRRDPATNVLIQSETNLSRATTLDANVSLTRQLGGGALTTTNFVGATYIRFYSPTMPWLNQASVGVMASSNTAVNMPNGIRAELNLFYRSPLRYGSYAFKVQYNGSVAVSKPVLKEKGTLTLTVLDLLNLQKNRYDTQTADVLASSFDKAESRFVRLNFSYRFGNQKVKIIRTRRTGIESEKMRLEGAAN